MLIACGGRALRDAETRWPPIHTEALAVLLGIIAYKHYFVGRRVTVRTDSLTVSFVKDLRKSKHNRLFRWGLFLDTIPNLNFVQVPGKLNVVADMLSRRPYDSPPPPSQDESQLTEEMMVCAIAQFADFDESSDSDGYESAGDVFELSDCDVCSDRDMRCDMLSECCSDCCSGFGCTRSPVDGLPPGRSPRAVQFETFVSSVDPCECPDMSAQPSEEPCPNFLYSVLAFHVARVSPANVPDKTLEDAGTVEASISMLFPENKYSPQACLGTGSSQPGLNILADEFLPRCAADNAFVPVSPELPLINASARDRAGDSPDIASAIHVSSPNCSNDCFSVRSHDRRSGDEFFKADNVVSAGRAFPPSAELIFSPSRGSGGELPLVNSSVNVPICAVIGPESDLTTRAALRHPLAAAPSAARSLVNDS